jgi:Domain of unknown function DUF29
MPGSAARLYQEDFVRWTEEQAAALRDAAGLGTNLELDWENLAEEIDGLGRSQSRELGSRIAIIIEHLIKLEISPAADPRPGWIDAIGRERRDIEDLLNDSPSLRARVASMIARETPRTVRLVSRSLRNHGETNPETIARAERASYTEDQVLGDWFPGDAAELGPLPAAGERE